MDNNVFMNELFYKAVSAIALFVLSLGVTYIKAYIKDKRVLGAVNVLEKTVKNTVGAFEQTVVSKIKEAKEDGTLTDEEKANIKAEAIASINAQLGAGTKELLSNVFGSLDEVIDIWIEGAVKEQKTETKTKELKFVSKEGE